MRVFTIREKGTDANLELTADYMTRDASMPNTLRFWLKGKRWRNRPRMVAAIENQSGHVYATSRELLADEDFLTQMKVKL